MAETAAPITPTEFEARATTRDRLAAASLWLPVLLISVSATLWSGRFGAELPMQWTGSEGGTFARPEIVTGLTGTLALLAAIAGLISLADAAASIRPWLVLAAGAVGGSSAAVWFIAAGLGLAGWPPGPLVGVLLFALTVVAAAYGFVPYLLSSRPRQLRLEGATIGAPLGASESAAWFTTLRVPMLMTLAAGTVLAAIVVAVVLVPREVIAAPAVTVLLLLVAAVCLAFSRIRVSIDARGLRVVSSLFHFPIAHVALERVKSARAVDIKAREWGGWGYRIMPGRTAVVVSGTRGILVERDNGTHFAVTVPSPELPAALLTTLATR